MANKKNTPKQQTPSTVPASGRDVSAPKKQTPPKSKTRPIVWVLEGVLVLAFVAAIGGFAFAATQEEHDSFCASCHTQPESTYYQRSLDAQPVDLASAHTPKNVKCIDCHSGSGVTGRMQAELLGAHNALSWYTGMAVQPAKLTEPIHDANCLKCHQEVTVGGGINNHFHAFLARWQAQDPNAATCVSCHGGHTTDGEAQIAFLNQTTTEAVCQACHNALGGGD
jgi:predicted CXXCH cytochrome family protein